MLVPFSELLAGCQQRGTALCALTCYNFEQAIGVLHAAQGANSGIVLLISEKSFASPAGRYLAAGLRALGEQAPTEVCLQLDHVDDLDLIQSAFRLGVGAVMADGSKLPFDQNIAFVRQAGVLAEQFGGEVEAELGRIEGNEDVAVAVSAGALTDPELAGRLVREAQPACLAVSIGNVHGTYLTPPALDWHRLAAIGERTAVPLSLHGASGLPDADVRRAISLGIRKVNVNTELREAYLAATTGGLEGALSGARVLELNAAQTEATAQVAAAKLAVAAAAGEAMG
jgi:tagatose 1,6-diphosphate aldolase GatY/KbaY